ncbi:MAG TPA: 16S rRNA (cytosine(1402)-N(4))-methyltransferase RsmH [Bacteroidetes bacterium]|nr:16S rRNA (cytosine(1402)-N(4))-methyltransferase RsmH [Bacteroidota bacterium]
MSPYHTPVLLEESIAGLNIRPDGIYVDLTFGGGGHTRAILSKLDKGRVIAFDQDEACLDNAPDDKRFVFLQQNFRFLKNNLRYLGIQQVDGILADLGVSSHHFDYGERGFSFRADAELDMRMNKRKRKTAEEVLNRYTALKLERVFRDYAEIRHPGRLVELILEARENRMIRTTSDLIEILKPMTHRGKTNKFLARIFQALRIEVNEEIEALKEMLEQTPEVTVRGGRLVVISYHSLEDRIVKTFMKTGFVTLREEDDPFGQNQTPFRMVNKKVITPTPGEVARNPRSRSAKLRIAERI